MLWLVAAFVVGFVLLWLVPALQRFRLMAWRTRCAAVAIGIVALVATPIIAVLVCFTMIGFRSVSRVDGLGAGIYLAKVMVAQFIGSAFSRRWPNVREHFAMSFWLAC